MDNQKQYFTECPPFSVSGGETEIPLDTTENCPLVGKLGELDHQGWFWGGRYDGKMIRGLQTDPPRYTQCRNRFYLNSKGSLLSFVYWFRKSGEGRKISAYETLQT